MRKIPVFTVAVVLLALSIAPVSAGDDEPFALHIFDVSALGAVHRPRHAPPLGPQDLVRVGEGFEEEWARAIEIDALADLIRDTIRPACWDEGGDVQAGEGGLLLVRCPPPVAREIGALLATLTSATSRRVRVSVETWEVPTPSWLAAGPAGADPVGIADGARTASASVVAWEGVPTAVSLTNRFSWISDYAVEVVADAVLADPIVSQADEGLALDVTAWPTSDGSRVLLEAFVQGGRFARPVRELAVGAARPAPLRNLQLPRYGFFTARVSGLVRPGEALVIPMAGAAGVRLAAIRVLAIDGGGKPGPIISTGALDHREVIHRLHLNALVPGIVWSPVPAGSAIVFGADVERSVIGAELMDLVTRNVQPDAWASGDVGIAQCGPGLFLFGPEELDRTVRAFISRLEQELLRTVRVDLRLFAVPGAVESGPRETFEQGEAKLVAECGATTLLRRGAFLVAGDLADHVADYDVEAVGGGGLPKQVIARTFAGLAAQVTPRATPDGSGLDVDLSLLLASRHGPDAARPEAGALLPLELVQTGRLRLDTTLRIAPGGIFVLDAGPDPSTPGRHLALVLRAAVE